MTLSRVCCCKGICPNLKYQKTSSVCPETVYKIHSSCTQSKPFTIGGNCCNLVVTFGKPLVNIYFFRTH
jgi:hypothetical protein